MSKVQNQWELYEEITGERLKTDDRYEVERHIQKAIYKGTDCGAWVAFSPEGVQVGSIVEGSDCEIYGDKLEWGFKMTAFWDAIEDVNHRASVEWEIANNDHTEECAERIVSMEEQRASYRLKWPRYCRTCNGWGAFYSEYDPSPAGVSLGSGTMTDVEPCRDCSEMGVCPRCGYGNFDPEVFKCDNCGWTERDGLPFAGECVCWHEKSIEDMANG
jgi:hypothetical protein